MRVDQPLYAMDLPGVWTLEELEGADRWVSGARELVVSVLRVPTGEQPDGETVMDDLANAVALSRQAVRNFARSPLTLDEDTVTQAHEDLVSASYTGVDEQGGQVHASVLMTTGAIDGLAYTASVYAFGPDAHVFGAHAVSSLELGAE